MNIISIIVGGLAASAMGLEYADLAPCGQTCIRNMFAQAYNMDCPPYPNGRPNLNCLCNDANFFNGIRDCAFAACNSLDAENTLGLAAIYCIDPKYKSPNYPCPPALVLPGTDVGSTSGSGSDGSTNSNSDTSSPDANGNNNNNNGLPRVDVLTYFSNGNTYVAAVTVSPAADNNGVVVSSKNGGGGGVKTATAYVAPTGLGNTGGNVNVVSQTSTSTNKVDYGNAATSTKSSSGAGATQEK
ncbi:unnamed protein product [Sordaria macrospora k-hell]|uniref:WGS project CABT00000000 data, contig 2.1 n=1 Tax=Sordaria macrospora (strain ATCC MYA-333 / DSM 997 / K(L3346) / K-hell) TaxID=771870 RepID=F7VLH4_SORMK|nr:uncharacterized protein SMAC_00567 [Sordaria macrospora k-hell]CCC06352.1 unnamed protein product [Sordaria macrospora k-hell]